MACTKCGKLHGVAGSCNCSSIETLPYYSGPMGYQGPQGPQGLEGSQGNQGSQGPQGSFGTQGNQGSLPNYLTVDDDTLWVPASYTGNGNDWNHANTVIRFWVNGIEQDISGISFNSAIATIVHLDGPELNHSESAEGPGLYGKRTNFTSSIDPFDLGSTSAQYEARYVYNGVTYRKAFNINYNVEGPQGWQGFQGRQGTTGADGVQGPQGSNSVGAQGVQGPSNTSEFKVGTFTLTTYMLKNTISGEIAIITPDSSAYVDLLSIVGKNMKNYAGTWSGTALNIRVAGQSSDICEFEKGFMESPVVRVDVIHPSGNLLNTSPGYSIVAQADNYSQSGGSPGGEIVLNFVWREVII